MVLSSQVAFLDNNGLSVCFRYGTYQVGPTMVWLVVQLFFYSITKDNSRLGGKSYDYGLRKKQMEEFPRPPLARFFINILSVFLSFFLFLAN